MATIKSYTSLEQSKVLVKILPIESADMRYGYIAPYEYSDRMYDGGFDEIPYPKDFLIKNPNFSANEYDAELPCWSLTALLDVIKEQGLVDLRFLQSTYDNRGNHRTNVWCCTFENLGTVSLDLYADNPVDACYELILKLHELKKL